jgi:diguanylate cyclase (GGDEF)-like protein
MWTALLCYSVTALLARDPAFARAVTVLGLALVWLPTTVAMLAARRGTTPGARTATAALGAFTLGLTLNGLELVLTGVVRFPSWGDPGYLAFYVLLPLALYRSSRGRIGRLSPVTVLDGLVAALGVAAVLSVPLTPPIERAHERIDLAAVIALSYPLLDLLVVGVLVWLVAVNAGALPGWPWLVAGLLLLAASDTAFAVVASDVLDLLAGAAQLGWVLGLAAASEWVVRLARAPASVPCASPFPADREMRRVATTAALSAGWASLAVLVVLLLAARGELPNETIVLAALMVVVSAIRTQIGFRLLLITRRLQAQALTDELTGLPNRRALRAEAARVLGAGPGAQHAVLVLDLDGFKDVNDTQGHGAGDAVLAEVATRIAGSVRQSDLVARTGGDEFVVLMPGADRGTALDVARRISAKVDRPIVVGTTTTHVTTSVGVALYPVHGEDMSTLVLRADRAMYTAKAGGSSVRVAEVPVRVSDTAVRVADDHDGANASA